MAKEFWIKTDSSETGPYSMAQIVEFASGGMLQRSDFISADRQKWTQAGKVNGLFKTAVSTPKAPQLSTPTPYSTRSEDDVEPDPSILAPAIIGGCAFVILVIIMGVYFF